MKAIYSTALAEITYEMLKRVFNTKNSCFYCVFVNFSRFAAPLSAGEGQKQYVDVGEDPHTPQGGAQNRHILKLSYVQVFVTADGITTLDGLCALL